MADDWRKRFDAPDKSEAPSELSYRELEAPSELSYRELEEFGTTDQLLTAINTAVEVRDDIHDAFPLMIRFFELLLAGAEVPKVWRTAHVSSQSPHCVQLGHYVRRRDAPWSKVVYMYPGNGYWVCGCDSGDTIGTQDTGFQHSIEKPEDQ